MNAVPDRMPAHEETHLRILKIVSEKPDISQRQLAARLGISLGKTNFLIKACNFSRAKNKLAYLYLLTPKGVGVKLRLTRAFLIRKEVEYEALRAEILDLKREIKLQ